MGPLEDDAFTPCERGYWPWTPWGSLNPEIVAGMFARGRILLQANLGGWYRTTRVDRRLSPRPPEGSVYVYGRVDANCYRCDGEIARGHQGLQNRVTYWCPKCQPE